jgi:hypothetical protein
MTDQADLERGYRRLLAWYPREFRRENGQEILAVLMAGARDGQRRPGLAAGAAVSAAGLIIGLALIISDIQVAARGQFPGHSLTADKPLVITVWIVFGLTGVSLWLWTARANGQGRNRARIQSTALFVPATLQLRGTVTRPGSHAGSGVTVLYYGGAVLFVAAWLAGGAAVWLLWRPASTAFFKPPGSAQALHQAHMGRTRPASIVQGTVAASGVSRADPRARAWPGVRRADRPRVSGGADARPGAARQRDDWASRCVPSPFR